MSDTNYVERFEFEILHVDARRDRENEWTKLQGSGGQLGNGSLYQLRPARNLETIHHTMADLLRRARAYEHQNDLRTWQDHDEPGKRICKLRNCKVLGVRAVGSDGKTIAELRA